MLKGMKPKDFIYQNVLLRIITSSSKKNNFYDKPTDSDVKRYEQIKS